MKWTSWSGALVVVVGCAVGMQLGVQAQSPAKKDAKMMMYTGCIEGASGHYMLNHAMMEPANGKGAAAKGAEKEKDLMLTSTAVDLSKDVGHKVTVSGSAASEKEPFMVKSVKMAPGKC